MTLCDWDPHIEHRHKRHIFFDQVISHRETSSFLTGPRGSDSSLDDLIDHYYSFRTVSQGGKIPIKRIVDQHLRTIV